MNQNMALLLWMCVSATFLVVVRAAPVETTAPFRLVILHTNDMHARFEQTDRSSSKCQAKQAKAGECYGGFARVVHLVRESKSRASEGELPPVLFLNAGDTYQGTVWYTIHKWRITAAFINLLQPDAMSLGNHEFDDGVAGLVPFLNNVTCPVLAANVNTTLEPSLNATHLSKSVVLDVNGVKVGVVGYLTPDTKNISQTGLVDITDEVPALIQEMKRLKETGVNILIALGHSGFDQDLRIAREVPDVDIVIGGHTNTFLYNGKQPDSDVPDGLYPTVVTQASGRKVPVVQAYAYTKYLGNLTVEFDKDGEAQVYVGNPVLLDNSIPQDADVLAELEKWRKEVDNKTKEKVGSSKVYLEGSTRVCRVVECNLGNLITDAMIVYHARNYKGEGWTDAPIAIQHGGGIRNSIDPANGQVTMEDLMGVLPFGNEMYLLTLNGSQLMETLEWSVYRHDPAGIINSGAFLQYSGIKVTYNMKQPAGHRVTSALARCGKCRVPKYEPIVLTAHYNLLVPQYLVNGGDSYKVLTGGNSTKYDYTDLDVVVDYFQRRSPVYPAVEGRIVFDPSLEEVVEDNNNDNNNKGSASRLSITPLGLLIGVTLILTQRSIQ